MTTIDAEGLIGNLLPAVLADLRALVAIESVSADPRVDEDVARSAERVAELFREAGCPDVRMVSADGGAPAVIARFPAPDGMPDGLSVRPPRRPARG